MSAEERYVKLETVKNRNGKLVYKSAIPLDISIDELNDVSLIVGDGDRIDVMAYNVYGSAQQWWRIASANHKVNGSLFFRPGTKIFIPKK